MPVALLCMAVSGCRAEGASDAVHKLVEEAQVVKFMLPSSVRGAVGEASVAVVEFGSYTCPYCQLFVAQQLRWLDSTYLRPGRIEFFYFEAGRSAVGQRAGTLLACMGRDRSVVDVQTWLTAAVKEVDRPESLVRRTIAALELSEDEVNCWDDLRGRGYEDEVATMLRQLDVIATPSFVVGRSSSDGEIAGWVLVGYRPRAVLKGFVEAAEGVLAR